MVEHDGLRRLIRRPVGAGLVWGLGLVLAAVAGGQSGDGAESFGERIEVATVSVDVWVRGADGGPATGLGLEDFEVLHDGEPVEITHFTEVRDGTTPASAPGESEPDALEREAAAPSHVIVYFDRSRIHPSNSARVVAGIEALLETQGVDPERVLLLRQDGHLSVVAPFGSTPRQLRTAFEDLGRGGAGGMALESEEAQALDDVQSAWEQAQDTVGSGAGGVAAISAGGGAAGGAAGGGAIGGSPRSAVGGPGSGLSGPPGFEACDPFLGRVQPIIDSWARSKGERVAQTVGHLADAVSFLAGLDGVKALFYVGDGLDTQPGSSLVSYATSLCPSGSADLLTGNLGDAMTQRVLDLTRHANTNRVTFYAVQSTGLQGSSNGDASSGRRVRGGGTARAASSYELTKRTAEREGLSLIAEQTGGEVVFNRNDLAPELQRIGRDLGSYYSLAYSPPAGRAGTAHAIEVRLRDGSLRPRFRRGYVEKDAVQWLSERIEGALNLGIVDNPLEVRLGAGTIEPSPEAAGASRVPLHVYVPVERIAFLPQAEASVAEVLVKVLARRTGSDVLATKSQMFRLAETPGATGFVQLTVDLDLAPGDYVTALGILDTATREASFVSTNLPVAGS